MSTICWRAKCCSAAAVCRLSRCRRLTQKGLGFWGRSTSSMLRVESSMCGSLGYLCLTNAMERLSWSMSLFFRTPFCPMQLQMFSYSSRTTEARIVFETSMSCFVFAAVLVSLIACAVILGYTILFSRPDTAQLRVSRAEMPWYNLRQQFSAPS